METDLLYRRRKSMMHNHARADANWRHCTAKVRGVGFFSRHIQDKTTQRVNLTRLLERMKTVHEEDREELENAIKKSRDRLHNVRPRSPEETNFVIPDPEEASWKPVSILLR